MEILVKSDLTIEIADPLNFRKFSLKVSHPASATERVAGACRGLATLEADGHAWVDAQRLLDWPGLRDNPQWGEGLRAMIEKARPHGWIAEDPLRIKAHIDWTA